MPHYEIIEDLDEFIVIEHDGPVEYICEGFDCLEDAQALVKKLENDRA